MAELKDYQEAVAKHGSIRAAARALGVDESSVRRALKQADEPVVEDYDGLISFATARQLEILNAIKKRGSVQKAAKTLKIDVGTVNSILGSLKARAARQGHAPASDMTHVVPDGFMVKGTSTYYDEDGKPRGQWVKSQVDRDRQHALMVAAADAAAQSLPRLKPAKVPERTIESLCNLYTFTDFHLGALSWKAETGADWDLRIAERVLTSAFQHMVDAAPAADVAFINQLGDFLHSDGSGGMLPITPSHGHILDQDGRFSKIVAVAIRVLRRLVNFALARHKKVVVLLAEGNHDMSSSIWLRALFRAIYENEPRVEVVDSELPFYAYEHGTNFLGFHHGHCKKKEQMPLLFAAQFPEMWGRTTKRVVHTGHMHHKHEVEHNGITVVQHRTIAARDAHSARNGYISERATMAITYHREFGEVIRNTVVPEMFEAV